MRTLDHACVLRHLTLITWFVKAHVFLTPSFNRASFTMAFRSAASILRRRLLCTESHSDFARVTKAASGGSAGTGAGGIGGRIKEHLDDSKVVLYMKGSPSQPQCGFSFKTVQILNALRVDFKSFNVLDDDDLRQGIKKFSSWPTIPQLFINGEFIGGCDIVENMARSGELQDKLIEAGVPPASHNAPEERW